MTQAINFRITGEQKLHCTGCEQRVSMALRRMNGVKEARASAHTQRVEVVFDPALINVQQVQGKLEQIGYQVALEGSTS